MRDLTRCVHHPAVSKAGYASLAVPTHRASTIVFPDAQAYADRKYRGPDGYSYGMHGTPPTRTAPVPPLSSGAAAPRRILSSGPHRRVLTRRSAARPPFLPITGSRLHGRR